VSLQGSQFVLSSILLHSILIDPIIDIELGIDPPKNVFKLLSEEITPLFIGTLELFMDIEVQLMLLKVQGNILELFMVDCKK
jgi:hypothetical protein